MTPANFPSAGAQTPQQLTTQLVLISPYSVWTPVTNGTPKSLILVDIPVTEQF